MGDHFGQIILIRPDQIWGDKLFRDTGTYVLFYKSTCTKLIFGGVVRRYGPTRRC